MLKCVLIATLAFAVPCAAAPADDPATSPRSLPRVRPNDRRSAAFLLDGIARSPTLRRIVSQLEESNVIVYIEMQPAMDKQLAGRLLWVTAVQNFRYVRISLNPETNADVAISTLGHELQHALEVAHAPTIVNESSFEAYYRANGISTRAHASGWDTQAARDAGDLVRREIEGVPARLVNAGTPFDPGSWPVVYRRARDRFAQR